MEKSIGADDRAKSGPGATSSEIEVGKSAEVSVNINEIDGIPRIESTERTKISRKRKKRAISTPELCPSNIVGKQSRKSLRNLPYYVVCRKRVHQTKIKMIRQMDKEILHIAMMQTFAIDGIRVNRVFSVGFPASAVDVPDFATEKERRRLRELLSDR